MDDASDDGSGTSERTVLSNSEEEKTDLVAHHRPVLSGPKNSRSKALAPPRFLRISGNFFLAAMP